MNNFNFNRDFYEGCRALGDREGMALAWAMLRYGYEGVEPKLKPTTMAAFTFARGRIAPWSTAALGVLGGLPMPAVRGLAKGVAKGVASPAGERVADRKRRRRR